MDLVGSDISLAPIAERDFQVIFQLKEAINKLKRVSNLPVYDFVFIDCLPSFGRPNLAALTAANYVLVPVKPAPYALAELKDISDPIENTKCHLNSQLQILGIVIIFCLCSAS